MSTIQCLTVETVSALAQEAAQAGDSATVRDCERTIGWLRTCGAAMGIRCRAAGRVARVLDAAAAAGCRGGEFQG
jgi:hypothetical protein